MKLGLKNIGIETFTAKAQKDYNIEELLIEAGERSAAMEAMHVALEKLEHVTKVVSTEGLTPSITAQFGEMFVEMNIDTAIGKEGVIESIKGFIEGVRNTLSDIGDWFKDKYLDLVDAHYEGMKGLSAWLKSSKAILEKADEAKVEAKTVKAQSREDLLKTNADLAKFDASVKSVFSKLLASSNYKQIEELAQLVGAQASTVKSFLFKIDYVKVTSGNGIDQGSKKTIKELGYSKATVVKDIGDVLKTLEGYKTHAHIWFDANTEFIKAVEKFEKMLAKKEDAEERRKLKADIKHSEFNGMLINELAWQHYKAIRQLSFQAQRVAYAFGKD